MTCTPSPHDNTACTSPVVVSVGSVGIATSLQLNSSHQPGRIMHSSLRVLNKSPPLSPYFFRICHMSSFPSLPERAPATAVDEFLTRVYTSVAPRNVFSVTVTGGGSAVLADLFTVAGSSNSLMHAAVPYSHAALSELLAGEHHEHSATHKHACSKETAILMAKAVFKQTVTQLLTDNKVQFDILSETNIFGVGCTATLVSSRPRRGLHRCLVSSFSNHNILRTWEVCFRKGARTRREEDYACGRVVLDCIATSCAIPALSHPYLAPARASNSTAAGEEVEVEEVLDVFNPDVEVEVVIEKETSTLDSAFDDLFSAKTGMLMFVRKPPSSRSDSDDVFGQFTLLEDVVLPQHSPCFVYPGSFNPLHAGHIALAAAAMQFKSSSATDGDDGMNAPLVFEISALNADKPPLSKEEILRRVSQFAKGSVLDTALRGAGITNVAICVTSRPYFQDKAALFPGCRFILGADTLSRLFLPKYYGHSRDNMLAALAHITQGLRCSFVVGGRKDDSGFCDLDSVLATVELPDCVREKLFGLTDEQFRFDISSTEIRNAMKK